MPRLVNAHELPVPKPNAVTFNDPRPSRDGAKTGVIGFTFLGKEDDIDRVCGGSFLSNWFDLSPNRIELTAPNDELVNMFTNAESAFHALKFWRVADTFATTPAKVSWSKYKKMTGQEDVTYGGYGNNWKAMRAVLTAKFSADPRLAATLRETGDAFLLHHVPELGRDKLWGDNGDGSGSNWLGLQLMLVRDEFTGRDAWTEYFASLIDIETGAPLGGTRAKKWQDAVVQGTMAVLDAVEETMFGSAGNNNICKRPGCGKPTWNGEPDEYCEGTCREDAAAELRAAASSSPGEGAPPGQAALPAPPDAKLLALPSQPGGGRRRTSTEDNILALPSQGSDASNAVGHLTTLMTVDRDMQNMRPRRGSDAVSVRRSMSYKRTGSNRSNKSAVYVDDDKEVDVNRPGILPTLIFALLWVGSAVAVLTTILWVYVYEEVRRHEQLATVGAVAHARFRTLELLKPAETVVRVVSAGFGVGAVGSLGDYGGLERLLGPHFQAQPAIHEVELAGPPEDALGTVHVSAASWHSRGILVRTDRPDCELVEGNWGCTLEEMRANTSRWYKTGFGIGNAWHEAVPANFWYGPSYSLSNPLQAICDDFCWSATYAFVGRVPGGPRAPPGLDAGPQGPTTTTAMPVGSRGQRAPPVLVRAAVNAEKLLEVVALAEAISRGEATVCTDTGAILASRDMANAINVDRSTGAVRPRLVWELDRSWASRADEEFVKKARETLVFVHGGYRVSAWKLGEGPLDTLNLGENLRIILAVPQEPFYDDVLGPLIPLVTGAAAAPIAILVAATFTAGLLRCVIGGWRRHRAAAVASHTAFA